MEQGMLQAGNTMIWAKKRHYASLTPKEGEVLLDKNYVTSPCLPAYICKTCKKVIADYE